MRLVEIGKMFVAGAVLMFLGIATAAQDAKSPDPETTEPHRPGVNRPGDQRGKMLRQLGLSRDQIEQIRQINSDRKPLMDEAQRRSRAANRALDEAIYADHLNEAEVELRLKEVQIAQGDVARIRYMNELSVRRILTPEQLTRFRELRRRFEEVRKGFENRRGPGGDGPYRRRTNGDGGKAAPGARRPEQRQNGDPGQRPDM